MKGRLVGGLLSGATGKISDKIQAHGHGRVCEAHDCATVLSIYNPGHYCSLHATSGVPRRP